MNMPANAQRAPHFQNHCPAQSAIQAEIIRGLMSKQKFILPKYFYDARGSELFEAITQQPEYYPTRIERQILSQQARAIAHACGCDGIVVEPGAGSCEKIRLLLPELKPKAYVPMDISADFLQAAARRLNRDYPWLQVHAVGADIVDLPELPANIPQGQRLLFYPGSSLGNFTREQARLFLSKARQLSGHDGQLLVGIDLHKDRATLDAAYNDAAGVTARFNLNVLDHIGHLTGADLNPGRFRHVAFYNETAQRIEMHLECIDAHNVDIGGKTVGFSQGERLLTEYSHKYTIEGFTELANTAELKVAQYWTDERDYFAVFRLVAA